MRIKYYIIGMTMVLLLFTGCTDNDVTKPEENTNIGESKVNLVEFNKCLAENGMVFYGANWCPHCKDVVEKLGGYETAEPVYIECTEEKEKCQNEMLTGYFPEIQINGEVHKGQRTLKAFSEATGCSIQTE